jgi:O-antigen/teichoic acid export membrane protein
MLKSVLSNSFFSLLTDIANRLSQTLILVLVTRRLGESAIGLLTLSNNYVLILLPIALWGLGQILIRDISRDPSLSTYYFTHFAIIRLVISLIIWGGMSILLLTLQPYAPETNHSIVVMGGVIVGDSLSYLGKSLFVALERVWCPALVALGMGILRIIMGFCVLVKNQGIETLIQSLVLASWIHAAILMLLTHKTLQAKKTNLNASFYRKNLKLGLPFVPIALFIALENQLGGILLSFSHSEAAVGYYGMANIVISALALISQAARVGIFPKMARYYQTKNGCDHFIRLYESSWRYLSIISLPLTGLLLLFSNQIIHLIYHKNAWQASATLQILAPTIFFYFLNIPNARLMILENKQHIMAYFFAISTGINISVSILLIPCLGPRAIAAARVVSMSTLFALNYTYVHKMILPLHPWRWIWHPMIAFTAMLFVIFIVLPRVSVCIRGLLGIATYVSSLIHLGAIPTSDWKWLRKKVKTVIESLSYQDS